MTTTARGRASDAGRPRERGAALVRAARRVHPELAGLVGLALVLNLWALTRNGWANTYYAAAVRSMSTSWHDFLYGSFDAGGLMTVDKPPLALWVQALSVRAFGYHSASILVPQALMGVAAVVLVWDLTRRRWGRAGGAVAGLAMATTPVAVAVARHNNPDELLVLCATAALWFTVRALETGRTRHLAWAGVCVGLGFETKMGAALLILPGLAAAWMWVAPRGRLAALRSMAAAGGAMLAAGLAWPVLVWLTPAADRPWISGTNDNSIWSLIWGYNGLGRLDGQAGAPAGGPGGGGGGGGVFGGSTGPMRLLNSALGGQAGWLLGAAVVGGAGILVASRLRRADPRTGWTIAALGALAVPAVAFSMASGIFHPYYVSLLAPPIAALVGGTVGQVLADRDLGRMIGPLAIAGGVVTEIIVLRNTSGQPGWWPPVIAVAGGLGAAALAAGDTDRVRRIGLAVALAGLMIAPVTWSFQTLGHATSGTFPAGGPATARAGAGGPGGARGGALPGGFGGGFGPPGGMIGPGGPGGAGMFGGASTEAVTYAAQHGGGTVVVASQSGASRQIISSGAAVAGIGGFSGNESEISLGWLAQRVADGSIRWVVTDSSGGGIADGRVGAATAMAAVQQVCTAQSSIDSSAPSSLYDCAGRSAALAALAR